jgi:hypothetical protein
MLEHTTPSHGFHPSNIGHHNSPATCLASTISSIEHVPQMVSTHRRLCLSNTPVATEVSTPHLEHFTVTGVIAWTYLALCNGTHCSAYEQYPAVLNAHGYGPSAAVQLIGQFLLIWYPYPGHHHPQGYPRGLASSQHTGHVHLIYHPG